MSQVEFLRRQTLRQCSYVGGLLRHALGVNTREGRKQDWAEGEVGFSLPHGGSGAKVALQSYPKLGHGDWTLYPCIRLCLVGGLRLRGIASLLK